MASHTAGIQQLLAAEKRAAEKVEGARKRKAKRLKQAKEEAQAEIMKYRQERERQFREQESRIMGSRTDVQAQVEQDTQVKLREIDQDISRNKEVCLKRILDIVYDVKPEVHQNYKVQSGA